MNKINWTAIAVFCVVVLLVFLVGVSLLGGWGYGGWGMMGGYRSGMMRPGMMGSWGIGPFGGIGMIFMWLIPVGLIVLLVLGIIWLVKAVTSSGSPPPPARTCPNCNRAAQADWHTCPYCGQVLP